MDHIEALEYIRESLKFGSILGLERIEGLLERMDNPHRKLKYVHVAGTNGKGSTVAFISSILMSAGYRVGTYTSPSIERFNERIRVNGEDIENEALARITSDISDHIESMESEGLENPTEFEITTALAFQYFVDKACDMVVLEVGLGGRLDSTNVIESPEVCVITTIDYDHMEILGNTLSQIASEKAGIIKPGSDVVLYPQDEEAEEVILSKAESLGARVRKADFDFIHVISSDIFSQSFNYKDLSGLTIRLAGLHQTRNASVAIEAAMLLKEKGWAIDEDAIRRGLESARWPGRFELLSEEPIFIADGAHNSQGVKILRENLEQLFPDRKITFIMGVLADKDYSEMISEIAPIAQRFITVDVDNKRALPSEELADIIEEMDIEAIAAHDVHAGIRLAMLLAGSDGIICSFGSLYYVGKVREYFNEAT
ncbi:bifunctional folylpolyglutamate synthase/dihydrofolate synthase [Youngiibacter fragilis]|uniref:tetrahydrofolate synthase n=1 Tax=Youngiibacter fragilis 232.1 TaxID=994573 RepID=V7ICG1_9CLOT|nr:folylpolyglutamate synthase/dihydrofolate synthase family protein [Youngiibacter fragilis]ETA82557.1 folylpolyglutamate synthase [Youngiibacter fragilis 232.1]